MSHISDKEPLGRYSDIDNSFDLLDELVDEEVEDYFESKHTCKDECDEELKSLEMDYLAAEEDSGKINVKKAVEYNRSSMKNLGWQKHFDKIVSLIGFTIYTPDEREFAEAVAVWQAEMGLKPDGKIGPNTWAKMQSKLGLKPTPIKPKGSVGPYPVVNSLMPKKGSGYYCRKKEYSRYGLPETVLALINISAIWNKAHPNGPLIIISDISKRGGGKLPPHKSHRIGLDVDFGFRKNELKTRVCSYNADYPGYWRSLTQELVNIIRNNHILNVKVIGFRDKKFKNPVTGVSPWAGHYCHLHVRFCMPSKYKRLVKLHLTYGSGKKPSYNCI